VLGFRDKTRVLLALFRPEEADGPVTTATKVCFKRGGARILLDKRGFEMHVVMMVHDTLCKCHQSRPCSRLLVC